MVLKKPYKFLIKNFKTIHLIITALIFYLIVKNNTLYKFFKSYASDKTGLLNNALYITKPMIFWTIIVIIICIVLVILMKRKNKPKTLYIIMIVGYLLVEIFWWYSFSNITLIKESSISTQTALLLRDLSIIVMSFQYVMIAFMFVRGLGFDIKKFNFTDDLIELDITEDDSEDFEFVVGIDINRIKRKTNRKIREFKYYFIENKLFIIIVMIIGILSIGIYLINNIKFEHIYKEKEIVTTTTNKIKVESSYYTEESLSNEVIANENNIYLIVKTKLLAIYSSSNKFALNKFPLITESGQYFPQTSSCQKFADIGNCYNNQSVSIENPTEYLFIYYIPKADIEKRIIFAYEEGFTNTASEEKSYTKIKLTSINLDEEEPMIDTALNSLVTIDGYVLNNSTFIINSYEISRTFNYSYQYCYTTNNCSNHTILISPTSITSQSKTIMKLNLNLTTNESRDYSLSLYDFISNYSRLLYKIDDNVYTSEMTNKTPANHQESAVYLEVSNQLENASAIWFEFSFRNKHYKYQIK
ncbi:MAG: hypothetical protein Q4G04_04515 [bacterium]|nr:hypothetical protein [bacterium]